MEKENKKPAEKFRSRPLEERKEKLEKLLSKNPNKVPIVFEKHKKSKLGGNDDAKFISTKNIKLGDLVKQLRDMWKLSDDTSLFFSCQNKAILKPDALIGDLYDRCKEEDGYLYIQFREVETFGFVVESN